MPNLDRLRMELEAAVKETGHVGVQILLHQGQEAVFEGSFGSFDREKGQAMDAVSSPKIRLASTSKLYTAATALALASQGAIDLDATVSSYIPGFDSRITIKHLLLHASGLRYGMETPEHPYVKAGISAGLGKSEITFDENVRRLASQPLFSEPGKEFHYSMGMDVLGRVLEIATGRRLQTLVKENVLDKLGLKSTSFHVGRDDERVAPHYVFATEAGQSPIRMKDDGTVYIRKYPFVWPPESAGDMGFCTARAFNPEAYPSGGAGMIGSPQDVMALLHAIRTQDPRVMDKAHWTLFTEDLATKLGIDMTSLGGSEYVGFSFAGSRPKADMPDFGLRKGDITWGGVYGNRWVMTESGLNIVLFTNTAVGAPKVDELLEKVRQAYARFERGYQDEPSKTESIPLCA